jgi:L-aspartate oxidase
VSEAGPAAWETTNLLTLSTSLAQAARLRAETRGSHWREDFPLRDDEEWAGHIDLRLVEDELELEFMPSPATDLQKEPT